MSRLTTIGSCPLRTTTASTGSSALALNLLVRHEWWHVDEITWTNLNDELQVIAPAEPGLGL
jgi:hypothetical protein